MANKRYSSSSPTSPPVPNPRKVSVRRNMRVRPAKSILPPDIADGLPTGAVPDRPILVRTVRLRYHVTPLTQYARNLAKAGKGRSIHIWRTLEVSIPREIIEIAGWEPGMTICVEAYRDKVRMFAAGDVMSREEEMI